MRAALLVSLLLVVAAPAFGHGAQREALLEPGTYLHHTAIHHGGLAAGAWNNTTLAFAGTPLEEGWFLLWSGKVGGNGTLEASVAHDETVLRNWTWRAGEAEMVVFRLPEEGFYTLRLHNSGPGNLSYLLYYDNTCDCTSKLAQLDRNPLWFNWDPVAPGDVALEMRVVPFTDPPGQAVPAVGNVSVQATVATWDGGGDSWPQDFTIVRTLETPLAPFGEEERFWRVDLGFDAAAATTHYVLWTLLHDGHPAWRFQVHPVVELPVLQQADAASVSVVLAGVVVTAVVLRRRA